MNLYYIHDPMCSWCWAFRPVWKAVQKQLPKSVQLRSVLGGLAPDSDQPMSAEMQTFLIETWRSIMLKVPETTFNFDFWETCVTRRSTYPACRAVIAAKNQGEEFEGKMIYAIQYAYYQQAKNPSDDSTLCELASEIGLDDLQFSLDLNSAKTKKQLLEQIQFSRQIGANSFPSLILQTDKGFQALELSYTDADSIVKQIVK